jgi:MFS family permease
MLIAPLSELYGRLVIYHACSVVYIGFIIGCALSTHTGMFLVFRFLAGCAASGPSTVGGGTVADVVPPAQRGKAMSLFFMGPLLGPVGCVVPV